MRCPPELLVEAVEVIASESVGPLKIIRTREGWEVYCPINNCTGRGPSLVFAIIGLAIEMETLKAQGPSG